MQLQADAPAQVEVKRRWRTASACAAMATAALLLGCGEARHSSSAQRDEPAVPVAAQAVASARGRVDIEGGVIRLAARRDGVIASVLVEEGDRVRAGQLLATLDAELAQRNALLAGRELTQTEQEGHKAKLELASAEREVTRLEPLAANETVARQELDRARDTRALAEVALRTAAAAAATARARLAVSERELDERKVVAPLDGQIVQRQARPGNGVSTLNVTPLFLFAPDGPHVVRAEVEEQYLGTVRANQPVQVVLEAQPERTWVGKVLRIGRIVGARTPSDDPTERQDNRVLEVVIALDSADTLLIGQRVIVRFLKVQPA